MIPSTSPSGATGRVQASHDADAPEDAHDQAVSERRSIERVGQPGSIVKIYPNTRPEVVERGRKLAADPAYPSIDIIWHISAEIVGSLDLAHDPSWS